MEIAIEFFYALVAYPNFHVPISLTQFWSSVKVTSFFMVQKQWYVK